MVTPDCTRPALQAGSELALLPGEAAEGLGAPTGSGSLKLGAGGSSGRPSSAGSGSVYSDGAGSYVSGGTGVSGGHRRSGEIQGE